MIEVKRIDFTSPLTRHGSWGGSEIGGLHQSSMVLHMAADHYRGFIEWDIPSLEECEEIGLWFEAKPELPLIEWFNGRGYQVALSDYDGVMSLPKQAWELMESIGIIVPTEFKE